MPLTADQEQLEHELRVEQMKTTIDSGRINIDKMRSDMRWETRKFVVSLAVGFAASVGAGVALANYVNSRTPPASPPQPTVIYLVPGQAPAPSPPR